MVGDLTDGFAVDPAAFTLFAVSMGNGHAERFGIALFDRNIRYDKGTCQLLFGFLEEIILLACRFERDFCFKR